MFSYKANAICMTGMTMPAGAGVVHRTVGTEFGNPDSSLIMPDFDLSGELSLKIKLHMLRPITEKVHSGNGPVSLVETSVCVGYILQLPQIKYYYYPTLCVLHPFPFSHVIGPLYYHAGSLSCLYMLEYNLGITDSSVLMMSFCITCTSLRTFRPSMWLFARNKSTRIQSTTCVVVHIKPSSYYAFDTLVA